MKKIFKFIKLLLISKYDFDKKFKKKILIYDESSSSFFDGVFKKDECFILNIREIVIYPTIFFKSVLKYKSKWNLYNYFIEIIDEIGPDFIFTQNDNDTFFWKLKFLLKKKPVTIFIQNGFRSYSNDIFEYLDKNQFNKDDFFVDFFLVFSESIKKKYKDYLNGKGIVIGSFKNNKTKILKNQNQAKSILFISEFASSRYFDLKSNIENYWYPENFFLPIIYQYAKEKSLDLNILGKLNQNKELKNEEIDFFNNILGNSNWNYIESNQDYKCYEKIDESKFVVFISSTLGFESITRGKPTAALCARNFKYKNKVSDDLCFAWPSEINKTGLFWTNKCDKVETIKILEYVNNINQKKWIESIEDISNNFMIYNDKNTIFYNLLESLKIQHIK